MRLILFFNGWGMDESVVENVKSSSEISEIEVRVINFPYAVKEDEIEKFFEEYEEIILVGWSFGCYYITKIVFSIEKLFNEIKKSNGKIKKVIGINGNGEMVGKNGITPKIFDFTLNTLTPDSLLKFYKNMGIDENFKIPEKEFQEVKYQLEFFKENYTPMENIFTEIVIGKEDKIVPAQKQKKYCVEKNISFREIEMGHFPFDFIKSWEELL